MATWRITAVINFPIALTEASPPAPGSPFPQQVKPISRISQKISKDLNGILITLEPWQQSQFPPGFFPLNSEPAAITVTLTGDTPENVLLQSEDLLEKIIDDLSFQLQQAVYIFQLEVLDVTPPLCIGMNREILLYPFPHGYYSPKYMQSIPLGNEAVAFTPEIRAEYELKDEKVRAALRWYIKGLATSFEVDKFAFYWISLEILCSRSDVVVEKPYTAKCGHDIPNCPVCNTSTSKEVNGLTIQKFLVEKNGIDPELARELWKMRQMFHGANHLSIKATKELPRLTIALRYAVMRSLKDALDILQDDLPIVKMDVPSISSGIFIKGTREIAEQDI
ncbi:MAG: hypothetical protein KAF91_20515 [Nostoc sp. TH1S01]|nr:hypothetical protein [Nostoc sp. TH1S01]